MKILIFRCFLVSIACLFLLSFVSNAQTKFITGNEYHTGTATRGEKWYDRSRRVETVTETIENGIVAKAVTSISEVLLPDRSRYYTKIVDGANSTEAEQITIDYMRYTRKDGGAWTKIDLRQSGNGSGSGTGTGSGSTRQLDQYSVESVFLNGMPVFLFEWLSLKPNGEYVTFFHSRKWVGDTGLPYRTEEVRGALMPRSENWRQATSYEYDPRIKIEAPIK